MPRTAETNVDYAKAESSAEKINGTAIWHISGVTPGNVDMLRETDAWIHLSDHGPDGWGVAATAPEISYWHEHLSEAGMTITPWKKMPYKPFGVVAMVTSISISLLGFAIAFFSFLSASIGLFFLPFIIIPTLIIVFKVNSVKCRHMRFAMGLSGMFKFSSIADNYPGRNVRS